jgi:hypothetical protein
MTPIDQILAIADAFASAKGLSESRISTLVFNDGKRLKDLRENDRDLGTKVFARAMQWFSDHWPEGAEWPEGVARPDQSHAQNGDAA